MTESKFLIHFLKALDKNTSKIETTEEDHVMSCQKGTVPLRTKIIITEIPNPKEQNENKREGEVSPTTTNTYILVLKERHILGVGW